MKIAVLVPVYNADRYLRECLDSVLAAARYLELQEGEVHTLDIRCCDDGSTDTSAAILAEYALRYEGVSYVKQANTGVVATRNRLIDELPVEYDAVAFVDADDLVDFKIYAVLAEALERTQADVAECGMPGNVVAHEMIVDDMSVYLLRHTAPGPWINVVNKLYRRQAIGRVRFRRGLSFEEDYFFNYEINANISRKVLVPEVFYVYRNNPDSATHLLNHCRYFESTTRRIRLSLETFWGQHRIPTSLADAWLAELSKDAFRMCLRKNLKKNRNSIERREIFDAAGRFISELEKDFSFIPTGLNPIQFLIWMCARKGYYFLARLYSYLT